MTKRKKPRRLPRVTLRNTATVAHRTTRHETWRKRKHKGEGHDR